MRSVLITVVVLAMSGRSAAAGAYGKIGDLSIHFGDAPFRFPFTGPATVGVAMSAGTDGAITPLLRWGVGLTMFDDAESLARPRYRIGADINLALDGGGFHSVLAGYQRGVGPLLVGGSVGGMMRDGDDAWMVAPEISVPLRRQWTELSAVLRLVLQAEVPLERRDKLDDRLVLAAAVDFF